MERDETYRLGYRDGRGHKLIEHTSRYCLFHEDQEYQRGYRQGQADALSISYVRVKEWERQEEARLEA